jgi:hypothetical protein
VLVVVTGPRGGVVNKRLEAYTKAAVKFFAEKLGVWAAPVRVHIKLHKKTYDDNADGYTVQHSIRKYVLDICMFNDWLTTLSHEMVHVKQFINREITHDMVTASNAVTHEEYKNTPYEKEAYALQDILVDEFTKTLYTNH